MGFKVPLNLISAVKQEINNLIKLKVIQKLNSEYNFRVFSILKKNGKIRMTFDYRKLNSIINKIIYLYLP